MIQNCEEGKKKQRRERERERKRNRAKTETKGRGFLAELSPLFLGWTLGGTKRRGDDFYPKKREEGEMMWQTPERVSVK